MRAEFVRFRAGACQDRYDNEPAPEGDTLWTGRPSVLASSAISLFTGGLTDAAMILSIVVINT